MFIDINTIGSDGITFDRALKLHGLEGPSREKLPDVDAQIQGSVVPAPGGADLVARVGATVPLTCSRCLETFPWDVRMDLAWKVLRQAVEDGAASEDAEADDEASVLIAPEGKIGLEDLATEQVYLNLPLKPVCSDGCKGLCPTCGSNRNLGACACEPQASDPRLAPLLQFRKKMQG